MEPSGYTDSGGYEDLCPNDTMETTMDMDMDTTR
jgi:hypothetical protein